MNLNFIILTPEPALRLFTVVKNTVLQSNASVYFSHFVPNFMFVVKVGAYPNGAPSELHSEGSIQSLID